MTAMLLTEHAPSDVDVLVPGAGGGLELRPWLVHSRAGGLPESIQRRQCWNLHEGRWVPRPFEPI